MGTFGLEKKVGVIFRDVFLTLLNGRLEKRVGSKDFYSGEDAQFQRRRTFNCTLQINTCVCQLRMFTLK